jgi:hypothetical protein
MTALDPALCARLVSEVRTDDESMTPAPWHAVGFDLLDADYKDIEPRPSEAIAIARTRNNLRDLADQLEAALAEVERMRPVVDAAERYATDGPVGAGICAAVHEYRKSKP